MSILLYDLCGGNRDLRFSPYCWRARMALAHKGLEFETVATPFTAVPGVEGGASKTVPVINDGGRIVADSFAIAMHLDKAYPEKPPLFGDDGAVATGRFLEAWSVQALSPPILRMIVASIHAQLGAEDGDYFRRSREARLGHSLEEHETGIEANAADLAKALEPLRRALAERPWLAGQAPAFADYIVFGTLMWLRAIAGRVPLAADDAVADWLDRCLDLHDGLARGYPTA